MIIVSFFVGQKFYKVNYRLKKILLFLVLALLFYFVSDLINIENRLYKYVFNFIILITYCGVFYILEIKKILEKNEHKNN